MEIGEPRKSKKKLGSDGERKYFIDEGPSRPGKETVTVQKKVQGNWT